jgi:predicted RNA methylase
LRVVSGQYWTPLVVAARAAAWFEDVEVRTVVDIGSGAGKFCVAAALAGRCHFTGMEQRTRLVDASRTLSQLFGVEDQVCFVEGTLGESAVPEADAYYLYNPFGENLFASLDHLDEEVELGEARYDRDIAAVEELLRQARVGTCVLTYNGFGGQIPPTYRELRVDYELPSVLRLWRKTSKGQSPKKARQSVWGTAPE